MKKALCGIRTSLKHSLKEIAKVNNQRMFQSFSVLKKNLINFPAYDGINIWNFPMYFRAQCK